MKERDTGKTEARLLSGTREKIPFSLWIGTLFVIAALGIRSNLLAGPKDPKTQEPTGIRETIKIGVAKTPLSSPAVIALTQRHFAKEDLDVTIKEYGSGRQALESMFAGEVDISMVADTPIVFSSFNRRDYSVFATFVYSYRDSKIISCKDKNINTGADLEGKKVGAYRGTSSHFFLGLCLTYNHLSISDVELIYMKAADLPVSLKNNEVDAISVWEPFAHEAKQLLQDKAIELPCAEIYRTTFNFAVMKGFARDHPETLEKFLRAVDNAVTFIKNNKEKSQAIVATSLNLDEENVSAIWDDYVFEIFLDQSLLLSWEDIARWAIKNKFTDKTTVPNYLNFIYLDGLEAVKPEAITIIR
ncbi:MAG: ABC transporter substrate-binding protein [Proteobacteria bacterium]|nr:ABC transporter substrate-binding protein [Pseudomonadota bacterium]